MRTYQPALDGLRALAMLAVVFIHSGSPVLPGGAQGVDVFFVLSGYLITSILKGGVEVRQFWWRRFRRLAPALLLMLAAFAAFGPVLSPDHAEPVSTLFAATYLTDYTILFTDRLSPLAHTWSLAIEEQFYLVWPLVLPFVLRRPDPARDLLFLWAGLTVLRSAILFHNPDTGAAYYPLHAHATGLVLGSALAVGLKLPRVSLIPLALMAAMFLTPSNIGQEILWRIPAMEVLTVLLIPELIDRSLSRRLLSWEPLRRLGLISYGVYLWHLPVGEALAGTPHRLLWTLAASTALAGLSWWTIERWTRAGPPAQARVRPA